MIPTKAKKDSAAWRVISDGDNIHVQKKMRTLFGYRYQTILREKSGYGGLPQKFDSFDIALNYITLSIEKETVARRKSQWKTVREVYL